MPNHTTLTPHHQPVDASDKVALALTKFLRFLQTNFLVAATVIVP